MSFFSEEVFDHLHDQTEMQSSAESACVQLRPGRPLLHIPRDLLEYYVACRFTIPKIAQMIGVSEPTKRRLRCYDIKISSTYSQMTDEQLDSQVRSIPHNFPICGYRSVLGYLRSRGMRVQEYRARESMRRVDPAGVLFRKLCTTFVNRRQYSVRAPKALWHVDGYHKLIR